MQFVNSAMNQNVFDLKGQHYLVKKPLMMRPGFGVSQSYTSHPEGYYLLVLCLHWLKVSTFEKRSNC